MRIGQNEGYQDALPASIPHHHDSHYDFKLPKKAKQNEKQ